MGIQVNAFEWIGIHGKTRAYMEYREIHGNTEENMGIHLNPGEYMGIQGNRWE